MAGHMPVNVMFRPLDKHKGHNPRCQLITPARHLSFWGPPVCGHAGKQTGKHQQVPPVT